jgi:6-phosphogluconate dehydrogenase
MQLGMVGLGRMGANLVQRVVRDGHSTVAFDVNQDAVHALVADHIAGASSLEDFVRQLTAPRAIWLMVPAAIVQHILDQLVPLLSADDVIIDGGNSFYQDDITRAAALKEHGIHYVDCGTSGGIWGLERGYSLMIGGEDDVVARLDPIFASISPGGEPSPGRNADHASHGYLHCGPSGAGHFVKMVHNGVEYGMMASIAEGLSIIKHANVGLHPQAADAETAPLDHPEFYSYEINVADVAEVWRHGSVVSSWLVDLTAAALAQSPNLSEYSGRVSDSGEGRWTVKAAIDESVPSPVISAALWQRYESRAEGDFTGRVLSAMRAAFGGHLEKPT